MPHVDCKRLNCTHSKWSFYPGFLCELKTVHLDKTGKCTDYLKQIGKVDAYKELLAKGKVINNEKD
jgi:hypothetical protein